MDLRNGVWAGRFMHLLLRTRGCCGPPVLGLEDAWIPPNFPCCLKEEQPNIGAPLLQAAWASCCQSPRLHPPAPCCPQHRRSCQRIFIPQRLASFQIPVLRLQMGYRHCLPMLPSSPCSLLCSNTRIVPFPRSSPLLSFPALLLTEPHAWLGK